MVAPFTQRWFDTLPQFVGAADSSTFLLRFMSLIGDQADDLEVLYRRIDFTSVDEGGVAGDTSELVDPDLADGAWLAWMATLVGVYLDRSLSDVAQRDAIRYAPAGWHGGTKIAVANAAKSALTGTKYARVYDHTNATSDVGAADEWSVAVVTRASETPSAQAVLDAVAAQRVQPAGVVIYYRAYNATWAQIQTAHPTWATRNDLTWTQLQETGL